MSIVKNISCILGKEFVKFNIIFDLLELQYLLLPETVVLKN